MMQQPCIYHSELFRSFHLILNSILFHTIQVHKLFSFDNRKKNSNNTYINKKSYSTIILTRMLHFMTTSIKNKSRQLYIHR